MHLSNAKVTLSQQSHAYTPNNKIQKHKIYANTFVLPVTSNHDQIKSTT